jgi:hypothetical protein
MDSEGFPKFSKSAQTGEIGVSLVTRLFVEDFNWIFRRVNQEHDFGIDAYIDIVEDDHVTGRSFAVQIKCGKSYFKESKYDEYWYEGEKKHLNYLLNHPVPVVIILVNPDSKEFFWRFFDINKTEKYGSGWRMAIPKSQRLTSNTKPRLRMLAGKEKDYVNDIDLNWKFNEVLGTSSILLEISRSEIESKDFSKVNQIFKRLLINSNVARQCQGCLTFFISGYDSDHRELYEIIEIREYFFEFESEQPLFYFLNAHPIYDSLMVLMCCICGITINTKVKGYLYIDPDDKRAFLQRNLRKLIEITQDLRLSEEEYQRISKSIMEYFSTLFRE